MQKELEDFYCQKKENAFDPLKDDMSRSVMRQFSNWLNGYVKAFNKMYKRSGALFMDYMKRSEAGKKSDVTNFIFYIHKNAVHHGLTKCIGKWEFDSYTSLVENKPSFLKTGAMMQWFGSRTAFIEFHRQSVEKRDL